ncbi:MAG: sodium-translocating pyrophosphatase [Chloroflexi bacterium]|nr:sodium-translocating pyrophosphatase [Chloroflexota bacterium]
MESIFIAIGTGVLALLFATWLAYRVLKEDQGTDAMKEIGKAIQEGASAFLAREYRTLAIFVVLVTIVIGVFIDIIQLDRDIPKTAISYLIGAICSAGTGYIGMHIAIRANTRTAAAAMIGLNPGLRVAFNSGAVMGTTVVGIGILGISILYLIFKDITVVAGFGFGASSIALFARVGGGIFTKAADVGSDIVGKVEAGIPEDDPRNPATIADNVGDNVGDVAGMGSDLFESYASSLIATIAIATAASAVAPEFDEPKLVLPLLIASVGIVSSLIGTFFVRTGSQASMSQLLWALRRGIYISSALVLASSYAVIQLLGVDDGNRIFLAIVTGLVAGNVIGFATEYYTSYEYSPTRRIAEAAQTGAGTTIITGFATGMLSTLVPVASVVAAILIAFWAADLYGVAIAAVGMLSTLGITLATDAYGPVADNAGGIAEQAHLDPEVRERTDALDSLGNTTAATGKGFAIGSAALTSLALLAAYTFAINPGVTDAKELVINILDPNVLVGLFIGALLPFIFSALTMQAVGTAAYAIVNEVRRQFREIPGIMEGTGRPDYARCVDISTRGSLRAMILPGAMAVIAPIAMGFILGPEPLGGMLIGAIASGFLLAVTMANSGGAWDNAKKYIEAGNLGGKGSDTHKAAVVGDTVGDPFKDTSGPSLNILIKLMSIVALVFAPVFI